MSMLLGNVFANRLDQHIYKYKLSTDLQSAYKRFHCSETARLKIGNDIVDNIHNDKVTSLISLDISAVFDTIDYLIPLRRLR